MIKNLELSIYRANEIYKPENFNSEFASISYYHFLKMKKIKIEKCSYIKILITNEKKIREWTYKISDYILFIDGAMDFTAYLTFPKNKKKLFQYEMIYSILKTAFIEYKVDWKILDDIKDELSVNNLQMKYEFVKKKIVKGKEFKMVIYMDIDAFLFIGELLEKGEKKEIEIFKSIPTFFAVEYLFKGYRFFDNKARIGSKEKAVFEIDFKNETVMIVDNNKMLNKLKYKSTPTGESSIGIYATRFAAKPNCIPAPVQLSLYILGRTGGHWIRLHLKSRARFARLHFSNPFPVLLFHFFSLHFLN
jgi:hypothetical protein